MLRQDQHRSSPGRVLDAVHVVCPPRQQVLYFLGFRGAVCARPFRARELALRQEGVYVHPPHHSTVRCASCCAAKKSEFTWHVKSGDTRTNCAGKYCITWHVNGAEARTASIWEKLRSASCGMSTAVSGGRPTIYGGTYYIGPTVRTKKLPGMYFPFLGKIFGPIYYGPP